MRFGSTRPAAAVQATPHERAVLGIGLAVFSVFALTWFLAARASPHLLDRDWTAFDQAGSRGWHGDWAEVYRASLSERSPYLYPPYAIWLALPLGLLPRALSYLVCALGGLGALLLALRNLVRAAGRGGLAPVSGVVLGSASLMLTMVTGQYSALYVLSISAAVWADRNDRPVAGGLALATLLLKPNIAAYFVLAALCRRSKRWLGGFFVGAAALVVSTAPFGLSPWRGFADALRWVSSNEGQTTVSRAQVTLLALLRVTFSGGHASVATTLAWAVGGCALGALAVRCWLTAPGATSTAPLRWWGTIALLLVAVSPRLYFYDALVLTVPGAAWYLERETYVLRWHRRVAAGALATVFVTMYPVMVDLPTGVIVGGAATVWLVVEALDLQRLGERA